MIRTLLLSLTLASLAHAQDTPPTEPVPSPSQHLGRELAADFELADWDEVRTYFERLARTSPRVQLRDVGRTTEDRPFVLAAISSPQNLAQLDAIRADAALLADPRGLDDRGREALLLRAKPLLFVSCNMHSTETASPQFAMAFAHQLATSDDPVFARARERLVVLLAPSLNPDGLDHVVSWYRRTVGTPHEGSDLPRLYQYYTGHDNNRDWFGLTQAETRIVTRLLYRDFHPQVYWDVHEQGSHGERFFVPPYRDPLDPNLDPAVIAGIDALCSRALWDMTRQGLTGIATGVTYDMWWNGGNRNVPVRHNILGILTEAASVELASPIFLPLSDLEAPGDLPDYAPSNRFPAPWPGGWWRLRDIVAYELAFGRSLLDSLSREPRVYLENALAAAERALARQHPAAWLIPPSNPDRRAARRLIDGLLLSGVEVHRARAPFTACGRPWPAGTLVIRGDQPYAAHVQDLFDIQRYPAGPPPYDVSGWTLPLLFGIHRVEALQPFQADLERIDDPAAATAPFVQPLPDGALDLRDGDTWQAAFETLARREPVWFGQDESHTHHVRLSSPSGNPGAWISRDRLPRIGVFAPHSPSKDEGWLRWVLDSWSVPFQRLRPEHIRAGRLRDVVDVLILPSLSPHTLDHGRAPGTAPPELTRGLAPEGAAAIAAFVRQGGTLIALGRSATWTAHLLDLPLHDRAGDQQHDFSCPGSVLRAHPQPHALTTGLPDELALFFSRDAAWDLPAPDDEHTDPDAPTVEVLLRYAPNHLLLSGWIQSPETIHDRAAWVRADVGRGRVHAFAFRPHYRGWSQATFPLLFRAILDNR